MNNLPLVRSPQQLSERTTLRELDDIVTERRIRTGVLNVYLGSTPALAGLEFCRHMLAHNSKDRRRVANVYIDTDDVPPDLQDFRREHQDEFVDISLRISVPQSINFAEMPTGNTFYHTFVAKKVPQFFASGAGGIRNNGHVAAAFAYLRIRQTIESAITAITALTTEQDEENLSYVLTNIVAFLGGGTGSGILCDVAAVVRQLVTAQGLDGRINMFCILPEPVSGSTMTDVSWRKSNAVATLLELMAYTIAPERRPSGQAIKYDKYMLHELQEILDQGYLANEVYLIGRTQVGKPDLSARIVGLDLYTRAVNAQGVGFLENSKSVDRRWLSTYDDRELLTFFGTSCPLEVAFPAEATAKAFAQISAARLLPSLASNAIPSVESAAVGEKEEWGRKWASVARLVETPSEPSQVRLPPSDDFTLPNLEGKTPGELSGKHESYVLALAVTREAIAMRVGEFKRAEQIKLDRLPNLPASNGLSIMGGRLHSLKKLRQEYETILIEYRSQNPVFVFSEGELQQKREQVVKEVTWFIPFLSPPEQQIIRRQQEAAESLAEAYRTNLVNEPKRYRRELLTAVANDLQQEVEKRISRVERELEEQNFQSESEKLIAEGYSSAAWHGQLDEPHPHMRHIFELDSLVSTDDDPVNLAVERLYWEVTIKGSEEPSNGLMHTFDEQTTRRFRDKCLDFLSQRSHQDVAYSRDTQLDAAELESLGLSRLPERVVEFFTDYYREALRGYNLLRLLEVGTGRKGINELSTYLFSHIDRMRKLIRELIVQEETLYKQGPERLEKSLYLGISLRKGSSDSMVLDKALQMAGTMTRYNIEPRVETVTDPHRLHLVYGLHGISMSTVPDFFRRTDSMMREYLRHQSDWLGEELEQSGQGRARSEDNGWANYGNNRMPVHSCGEGERLVCDPKALRYDGHKPHSRLLGPSLVGRVIRDDVVPPEKPNWNRGQPDEIPENAYRRRGSYADER